MYALSKSIVEFVGQERVELYSMKFLNHDATVSVELKIIGDAPNEAYIDEYEIERADGKKDRGSCLNRATKETTIEAIEEKALEILGNGNYQWDDEHE